jgi:hypothetical protein
MGRLQILRRPRALYSLRHRTPPKVFPVTPLKMAYRHQLRVAFELFRNTP